MSYEITPIFYDEQLLLQVRHLTHVGEEAVTDADIEFYFEQAENTIESDSGKKFVPTTIEETRDGDGSDNMILYNIPIISIESLTIDGTSIDSANYVYYPKTGKLTLTVGTFTTISLQNIVINYTYGDVDNFQNMQNLAFYMACVKTLWSSGAYEAQGATSEKYETYTVNYAGGLPYSGLIKDLQTNISSLAKTIGAKKISFGMF